MKTGGCQCGAVRYELRSERIISYVCHCRECQKQSAAAFGMSVPVLTSTLQTTGPLSMYQRDTDSGSRTECWFCSACGTRIYHQSVHSRDFLTLKGGTIDDAATLEPIAHLWVSRKQAWVVLPTDVPAFETQPDNLKAWRDALIDGTRD